MHETKERDADGDLQHENMHGRMGQVRIIIITITRVVGKSRKSV